MTFGAATAGEVDGCLSAASRASAFEVVGGTLARVPDVGF
jgi:hypothetical protein